MPSINASQNCRDRDATLGKAFVDNRMSATALTWLALAVSFATLPHGVSTAATGPFRVVLIDGKGAPVADAVVTLRPATAAAQVGAREANSSGRPRLSVPAEPVIIEQLDREFVPRVTVVPVGARVSLPNGDGVPHSVYSFSPAKQFEFDAYVGSSPQILVLDKLGVITLGCNIHDWMVGYIAVVDTPYAVKTDVRGVATIARVPDGDYELRVWHARQRSGDHVAQLMASDSLRSQSVVVDVSPPRVRYKPPLTLKRY